MANDSEAASIIWYNLKTKEHWIKSIRDFELSKNSASTIQKTRWYSISKNFDFDLQNITKRICRTRKPVNTEALIYKKTTIVAYRSMILENAPNHTVTVTASVNRAYF